MNKNTIASQKFRKKKASEGIKEVRGIMAPLALHKVLKDKFRLIIKKLMK